MFNFFRPKEKTPELAYFLRLDDVAFVSAVKKMLELGPPAAWAMCVVAYQNLNPILSACDELSKEHPASDVPADLDAFIQSVSSRLEQVTEEIARRRLGWFFQAALIRRATEIASRNTSLQEDVAAVWIMLARGSAYLPTLLSTNVIWSDDEKAYFDVIKSEKEGIHYCLRILAPAYLRTGNLLTSFAESQDILLVPW